MVKRFVKQLIYWLWVINGYLGFKSSADMDAALTVLVTYYSPLRMKHLGHQVRNLLRCGFIKQIVISNHNPQIRIEDKLRFRHERLVVLNQEIRRGCGYRWSVAEQFSPEYLIVIDDDLLLFPSQVRALFQALLAESESPHGYAGMVRQPDGSLEYHQKVERSVDYLCEVYAVTGQMLTQYFRLKDQVPVAPALAKSIECTADFVIISQTGREQPKIHKTAHLLRCPTFNQAGVAVHKEQVFLDDIQAVETALTNVQLQA